MKKQAQILVILLGICFVVPQLSGAWIEVKRWTGSGIKHTESFTVTSDEWRIRWRAKGSGLFQIYVYKGSELKTVAANQTEGSDDSSYISGSGRHKLTINCVGIKWTVVVEDER